MALVVSVLYRGSAIPVAWAVLPGNAPGAWMGPILRLLRRLRPAVPPGWTVLVLADRGLWSPRLWRRIRERVKTSGTSENKVREEFRAEFNNLTRFGTTDDIASLIAFIVSPHGRWLHGATIDMDGGEVRGV